MTQKRVPAKKANRRRTRISLPAAAAVLAAVFFLYMGKYYRADPEAAAALVSDQTVTVTETGFGWFFDGPGTGDALIFYPGAKVEEKAYAPFMHLLAEEGTDVFLVRMPFRFALFGISRADGIIGAYEYDRWFIGGHSLGGVAAAYYAAGHPDLAGIILCAAYPAKQLDKEDLELVIYGSEDGVLNRNRLSEGRRYASDHMKEYEIAGGNHAQFGNYGEQSGDGRAAVTADEQQRQAAEFILRCLREQDSSAGTGT